MEALTYAQAVFISVSTLVNIILAVLIVFRLVYLRRYARNALGVEHGSPYTNIIIMCVESSALMVVASSLYTILFFMSEMHHDETLIVVNVIPHICVGGLQLNDFSDAQLRLLLPLGHLPTPHRLSRRSRSRHTPNFTAIGASDGPASGQHSTFKPSY